MQRPTVLHEEEMESNKGLKTEGGLQTVGDMRTQRNALWSIYIIIYIYPNASIKSTTQPTLTQDIIIFHIFHHGWMGTTENIPPPTATRKSTKANEQIICHYFLFIHY